MEVKTKDRFFDPFRSPRSAGAKKLVEDVLVQLQGYEEHFGLRKRARKKEDQAIFEETVAAIVCDLAHRFLEDPSGRIAIRLSNRFLGMKSRYRAPALSKALPTILKRLCTPDMDFVQMTKGTRELVVSEGDDKAIWKGTATVIWPGQRLISRMDLVQGFDDFTRSESEEIIILKSEKPKTHPAAKKKSGKRLEYEDTDWTIEQREKLREINNWLDQADIEVDQSFLENPVNPFQRRLHRSFNNGSFDHGGRLSGGFWLPLSKEERSNAILINDDYVWDLDYGQMGLRLLYGYVGATLPDNEDLYDIPELPGGREGIKKLISSSIYRDKPIKRYPAGVRELSGCHGPIWYVMSKIEKYHSDVADHFYKGLGVELMRKESDVMIELLLALKVQDIVALPIHDGILVADEDHEAAAETMKSVFLEEVGVSATVKAEGEYVL